MPRLNHSDPVMVWVQKHFNIFLVLGTELNKVLLVWHNACGMGQGVEGGKVGWWVSLDQLGR